MYCKTANFKIFEHSKRKTKKDFVDYCFDLHKIEGGILIENKEAGFSFAELFELAVKDNAFFLEACLQADLIIVIHSSYEYDPDYAHIVSYLINRFSLTSEIVAFSAPQTRLMEDAHHLMTRYLFSGACGVIIQFEQHVLPLRQSLNTLLPDCSEVSIWQYLL